MSIMKTKMLYAIIVIAVIAVAIIGWYYYSSMAAYTTKWQCRDVRVNTTEPTYTYICNSVRPSYPPYYSCTLAGLCGGGGGGGGGGRPPLMT